MGQVFGITCYIETVCFPLLCVGIYLNIKPKIVFECGSKCGPKFIQKPMLFFKFAMNPSYYIFKCVQTLVGKYSAILFNNQTCVVEFECGANYRDKKRHQIQYRYKCKFNQAPCTLCLDNKILDIITKLVEAFYCRHNYTLEVTITPKDNDKLEINILLIFNGAYFTTADKSIQVYNEGAVFVSKFNRALAESKIFGKLPNFANFCCANYIQHYGPGNTTEFKYLNI